MNPLGLSAPTPVPVPRRAGRREWAALSVLVLAVVLLAVDGTVLALAVPALTADLAPSATELLWIGDVYSFALAGLLVTMGTLGDRIGRKRLLLIGAAGFGAASVLAAFATTPEALIGARVLLGVAGATLMPSTLSLIRNLFADQKQRTTAIALWAAAAAGGAAAGPLIGGVLLESYWWGSVFLINVPVMAVLIVGGFLLIPESRDPSPGRFDLLSAALSVVAIVPVVFAVKEVAAHGPTTAALIAVALGVAAGWTFLRRQRTLASPLLDVTLFSRPAFSGAVVANLLSVLALSGLLFFFSQYLQLVRGFGPLEAGVRELPLSLASMLVVAVAGVLVLRLGRGRVIGLGLIASAAGFVGLALAEGVQGYVWLGLSLVVVGLGVGLALTLTTDAVMSAVPKDKAGSASAVSETAYELGVALGIGLLGSLLTALYRGWVRVPAGLDPAAAAATEDSLAATTSAAAAQPPAVGGSMLEAARAAFTHAMQVTSVTAAVALVVAAVVAWKVVPSITRSATPGEVPLDEEHATVDVTADALCRAG